jgi:DNA-directed RNA polymerase specialized sigma24 family protein
MVTAGTAIDALESLYRTDLARFVRAAAAIAGDEGAGRDAVQEAFAQGVRKRRASGTRRRSKRGSGGSWSTRHLLSGAGLSTGLEGIGSLRTADSRITNRSATRRYLPASRRSPERQRLAVFLGYFADLDYRSIASVLEVDVGTVSATLATAHAALRRSYEEALLRRTSSEIADTFARIFPPLLVAADWPDVMARADGARTDSNAFSGIRAGASSGPGAGR